MICKNCGHEFTGAACDACGLSRETDEKRAISDAARQYQITKNSDDFTALYNLTKDRLYACIYARTRSKETAEDYLQETYLKIARSIQNLKSPDAFLSWAYRAADSVCLDHFRVKVEKLNADAILPEPQNEDNDESLLDRIPDGCVLLPDKAVENEELGELLREKLGELPEMQRLVFIYKVQSMPEKEIAEILGINLNTVKTDYRRASAHLSRSMHKFADVNGLKLVPVIGIAVLACLSKSKAYAMEHVSAADIYKRAMEKLPSSGKEAPHGKEEFPAEKANTGEDGPLSRGAHTDARKTDSPVRKPEDMGPGVPSSNPAAQDGAFSEEQTPSTEKSASASGRASCFAARENRNTPLSQSQDKPSPKEKSPKPPQEHVSSASQPGKCGSSKDGRADNSGDGSFAGNGAFGSARAAAAAALVVGAAVIAGILYGVTGGAKDEASSLPDTEVSASAAPSEASSFSDTSARNAGAENSAADSDESPAAPETADTEVSVDEGQTGESEEAALSDNSGADISMAAGPDITVTTAQVNGALITTQAFSPMFDAMSYAEYMNWFVYGGFGSLKKRVLDTSVSIRGHIHKESSEYTYDGPADIFTHTSLIYEAKTYDGMDSGNGPQRLMMEFSRGILDNYSPEDDYYDPIGGYEPDRTIIDGKEVVTGVNVYGPLGMDGDGEGGPSMGMIGDYSVSFTYDSDNRISSWTADLASPFTVNVTYENGLPVSLTVPGGGENDGWTLEYDKTGRISHAVYASGAISRDYVFSYDSKGRLLSWDMTETAEEYPVSDGSGESAGGVSGETQKTHTDFVYSD